MRGNGTICHICDAARSPPSTERYGASLPITPRVRSKSDCPILVDASPSSATFLIGRGRRRCRSLPNRGHVFETSVSFAREGGMAPHKAAGQRHRE